MKKGLRNIFVCSAAKGYKGLGKMILPTRTDTTVEGGDPHGCQKNTLICKILRAGAVAIGIILLLWLVNSQSPQVRDDRNFEASSTCTIEIGDKIKEEIKSWIQKEIEANSKTCSKTSRINPEQMRNIVKEEIRRQQKIQLKPDFASASAGGLIVNASPTWTEGYSYIYFLFIPIRSTAPPPSIVLEPTRQPGDCWPMKGQNGMLMIQLAARANIAGFTMEHIDPAMSLSGGTSEAPKNFSVYGIEEPDAIDKKYLFGTYSYNNKNDESQYFRVQNTNRKSFLYVMLEIMSNHGNDKYTCLYRFQVHGFIDRAYHCQ